MENDNPAGTAGTTNNNPAPAGGEPAAFSPILTQADFDAAIAPRLERERRTAVKPYSDYETIKSDLSEARTTNDNLQSQLNAANEKIKGYETDSAKTRIALEVGLPYGLASRLSGETEEAIRADAKALAAMLGGDTPPSAPPPLADTEAPAEEVNSVRAFLRKLKQNQGD